LDTQDVRARVASHKYWYHTIDVAPGVATPGWYDTRPVVDLMPWPDVQGKRCLDIGTFDGFLALELERRGATEVVAIDIPDHNLWDWPPDYRAAGMPTEPGFEFDEPRGTGFRLIKELTGSAVDWRPLSIYDLDPADIGTFDVVVMGSLLLHLRDPLRALEAVRRVVRPDGFLLSSDQIEAGLTLQSRRKPLFTLNGSGGMCQWFNFNAAGHERMLFAAGFEVQERSKPFIERFNKHPRYPPKTVRQLIRRAAHRYLTGTSVEGVLHQALLATPRF
jgi:tRNA (mo5U34)-methyltransferase